MKHDALRMVLPGDESDTPVLFDHIPGREPGSISMITLTVRGVTKACLERVLADLDELIVPSREQVLPGGFEIKKQVLASASYDGHAFLIGGKVDMPAPRDGDIKTLVGNVARVVLNAMGGISDGGECDVTVSLQ